MPYKPPPLLRADQDVDIQGLAVGETLTVTGFDDLGNPTFGFGAGAGIQWEEIQLPADETGWDTAGAQGVWAFNPDGSISQTGNGSVTAGGNFLSTLQTYEALAWAVQATIRFDDIPAGSLIIAAGPLNEREFAVANVWDSMDMGAAQITAPDSEIYPATIPSLESSGAIFGHTIINPAIDTQHTIYSVYMMGIGYVYMDGDFEGYGANAVGVANGPGPDLPATFTLTSTFNGQSDFPATFSDLRAFRIPVPRLT